MARTVSRADAACSPAPKLQPTEPATLSAEAHVESMAFLQDAHRTLGGLIQDAIAEQRRTHARIETMHALRVRIERLYPEIQAGQHAAEELVAHVRRARIKRANNVRAQVADLRKVAS